jgi:NTE family protein
MTATTKTTGRQSARAVTEFERHDHRILLLQGGGALGAYHGGVCEGLATNGFAPDWVVGISIGATNAALIVGNPPERRTERLREFWNRVSAQAPFVLPAGMDFARPLMNRMAAASAMFFGIPGFSKTSLGDATLWVMRGHEREDEGRPIAII